MKPAPQLLRVLHLRENCPGCLMELASVGRTKAYELAYQLGAFSLGTKGDLRVRADKYAKWVEEQATVGGQEVAA